MAFSTLPITFVSAEFVSGAFRLGVVSLVLGGAASIVPVPFLGSRRLRSLFASISPLHWAGTYFLVMTVIGGGEIWLFALTVNVIGIEYANPAVTAQLILYSSVALFMVSVAVLWIVPIGVLPRLGIDWDENGYDVGTVGFIGGVVVWYHVVTVLLSPYAFEWLSFLSPFVW